MARRTSLRHEADADARLWLRLRALSERGWHFRRGQHFRTFRLPFVEHDALLVVEFDDGGRSIVRDRLLAEAGYTVLRFRRDEPLSAVVAFVCAVLEDRRDPVA